MKNIFKTFLAAVLLTGVVSCDEDQDLKFVQPPASFQIITPQSGESVILNPAMTGNPGLVLAWEDVNYNTPTTVTYSVEGTKNGSSFDDAVTVASTTNTYISIDAGTLNTAVLDAGLAPFTESGLDVRIKATVGAPATMESYSNVITYLVTPFSDELPKLAVVGNHQCWNPTAEDVPLLASPAYGQTNYEGYVWLDGDFKILAPNAEGNFNWASDGGGTEYGGSGGNLVAGGGNITAPSAGYYLVRVDTTLGTYSLTQTNWGVVGNATPGSWDNSTPMTYDMTSRTWSVTVPMVPQTAPDNGWKFRANNAWTINMGDTETNSTDGTLKYDGSNIGIAAAGNYHIVLDLSHPRAYTYTITQQ